MLAAMARPSTAAVSAAARLSTVSRHLSSSAPRGRDVRTLTVFGAGSMGSGIAQVAAQAGIKVTMTDLNENALSKGLQVIEKSLARVAKKQSPDDIDGYVKRALANIQTTTDS